MENKTKDKLYQIVEWLDRNYNQDSENYDIFFGAKPSVIRFDDDTAVSLWPCGAVVCIGSLLYFIEEDDAIGFCVRPKKMIIMNIMVFKHILVLDGVKVSARL
jgi:hypothetical protein